MSNRIKELKQEISQEFGKVEHRIAELMQQNEQYQLNVNTHNDRYILAVQEGADDATIDGLNAELEEAERVIKRNNELIRILNMDPGSRVQRLRSELVGEYFEANDEINAKAAQLSVKLNKMRDELIQGTKELMELNTQQHNILIAIDHTPLDEKDIAMYGLKGMSVADKRRSIADQDRYRKVVTQVHQLQFKPFIDCK